MGTYSKKRVIIKKAEVVVIMNEWNNKNVIFWDVFTFLLQSSNIVKCLKKVEKVCVQKIYLFLRCILIKSEVFQKFLIIFAGAL